MNANVVKYGPASWGTTGQCRNSIPASRANTASAAISPNRVHSQPRMREPGRLVVGGLTPFTTIDFPGRLAAVVFCQGCPWRCGYCHNPHLLPRREAPDGELSWQALVRWLESRHGLLDGVVFSGGEPLLQRTLYDAVATVRQIGFAAALHTGGAYPNEMGAALGGDSVCSLRQSTIHSSRCA